MDVMFAFIDLEFGALYGSPQYRELYPFEIGILLYNPFEDVLVLKGTEFRCNVDLILRKNKVDLLGKVVGVDERIVNSFEKAYNKPHDKHFRLPKAQQRQRRKQCRANYDLLERYLADVFREYHVQAVVFWGKELDVHHIHRTGFRFANIPVIDLQKILKKYTRHLFSLDKLSNIIEYQVTEDGFQSHTFHHRIPKTYLQALHPHTALGDVTRIFAVYKEFVYDKHQVITECRHLVAQLEEAERQRSKHSKMSEVFQPEGISKEHAFSLLVNTVTTMLAHQKIPNPGAVFLTMKSSDNTFVGKVKGYRRWGHFLQDACESGIVKQHETVRGIVLSPPDIRDIDHILSTIPRKKNGVIKRWLNGYGFIEADDGDYFFLLPDVSLPPHDTKIRKGDAVYFEIKKPPEPDKLQGKEKNGVAVNVRFLRTTSEDDSVNEMNKESLKVSS